MSWDPITRIVGSLGIYTKIDFANREGRWSATARRRFSAATASSCRARTRATRTSSPAASAASAATTTPPAPSMRRTWPTASSRRHWPNGSSTSAKPPNTCSTTTSSRTTWSAWTSANRWSRRPIPACGKRRTKTEAPHAADHGYRTIADIMRALNPFEGEFYRETCRSAATRARCSA